MKSIAGLLEALSKLESDTKGKSLDDLAPDKAPIAGKISVTTARPIAAGEDDDAGGIPSAMKPFAMSDDDQSGDVGEPDDDSNPTEPDRPEALGPEQAVQDEQIVDTLEREYPDIYQKIAAQLDQQGRLTNGD